MTTIFNTLLKLVGCGGSGSCRSGCSKVNVADGAVRRGTEAADDLVILFVGTIDILFQLVTSLHSCTKHNQSDLNIQQNIEAHRRQSSVSKKNYDALLHPCSISSQY
jgi:hypothetical protein